MAVWAYDLFEIPEDPAADAAFRRFHASVESYWPPERALVTRRYADLLFPFEEISVPPVPMTAAWSLERVLGYLSTWSAVRAFVKATGEDPVAAHAPNLAAAWGDAGAEKTIVWPLVLRAGRIA